MERERADLACPLVLDAAGRVGWLPGLAGASRELRRAGGLTPDAFRARFGNEARDLIWAQGICLLVARHAVEAAGLHRDDFWVRGEDLDFSLRLTARGRGIFVPGLSVQHLPPPGETDARPGAGQYLKHCALIQNIAFIGFRLPHGHRIAWTIVGALRHFFSVWKWAAFVDALGALWRGTIVGEPAGRGSGRTFYARFTALCPPQQQTSFP
jgi:GT2 family glycosyltransferase